MKRLFLAIVLSGCANQSAQVHQTLVSFDEYAATPSSNKPTTADCSKAVYSEFSTQYERRLEYKREITYEFCYFQRVADKEIFYEISEELGCAAAIDEYPIDTELCMMAKYKDSGCELKSLWCDSNHCHVVYFDENATSNPVCYFDVCFASPGDEIYRKLADELGCK